MLCAADPYFKKKLASAEDPGTGVMSTGNVFVCEFCEKGWSSMTGTKKMACLCQLIRHGVIPCPQTKHQNSNKLVETLLPLWAGGQQHLAARERL